MIEIDDHLPFALNQFVKVICLPQRVFSHSRRTKGHYPKEQSSLGPFLEVLELLKWSNEAIYSIRGLPSEYTTWDHETTPMVYISTLGSTIAIPKFIWQIYTTVTELRPLLYPSHPPSYSRPTSPLNNFQHSPNLLT